MPPPMTLNLSTADQLQNYECLAVDVDEESEDWQMPLFFNEKRHNEDIIGSKTVAQTWRMKERVGSLYCRPVGGGFEFC